MPARVAGDGRPTRVNIATVEIPSVFVHETIPSRLASAIVTAHMRNPSQLVFLPGQLSVFLNNSFVASVRV
jgi:hypothetical protein